MLDHLRQDIRFGLRTMLRTPGLTAIVLVTLALGIGATTAMFSILQAVLLRPLPYRHADRMVAVWDGHLRDRNLAKIFASYDDFETWRDHSTTFEQFAATTWATGDRVLSGRGPARVVLAIPATVELFELLGVAPAIGRTFQPEDLSRGCTVVLAHTFWQNTLHGDPSILGQSVTLDDRVCTVIGVMPVSFAFYPEATELWSLITSRSDLLRGGVAIFGRMKPGVRLDVAQAELTALHRDAHGSDAHGAAFTPTAYELQSELTWLAGRNLRLTLLLLFGAVSFVLLIACVNVANLLLGRSAARERELAIRAALGSGRRRLVGQLLTEGLLLSTLGALLGTGLAAAAVHSFRVINPVELPPGSHVGIDASVLMFSIGLAIATALLFGLAPALKASRIDAMSALKSGGRTSADSTLRRLLGKSLVVIEVGCSVVLLAGAALLIESVGRFGSAPLGFDPDGVLTMVMRLPVRAYGTPQQRTAFYDRLLSSVETTPGVERASLATTLVRGRGMGMLAVEGRPEPTPETALADVGSDSAGPDYFRVMKVPLLAGRYFEEGDRDGAPSVAIVNEALARKYFPDGNALGQRIRRIDTTAGPWLTIVGVVGNEKGNTVYQEMNWVETASLFRPIHQTAPAQVTLMVRAATDVSGIGAIVQQRITALDPDVPLSDIQTMNSRLAKTLAYPRFRAALLGGFAALALLLAVVGLYGVLSQLVAQRTQEIGIRMALGATTASVLTLVAKQGLTLTGAGLGLGLLAALWLGRLVGSMLYGVEPTDVTMLATVSLALGAAAMLATYLPARRATRVDPVETLRA